MIKQKLQNLLRRYQEEEEEEDEDENEYSFYNENYDKHIFLAQMFSDQKEIEFTLPQNISLLLTSASFGVKANCKNTQCVTLSIQDGFQDITIARLIPNKLESQQLDLEIPQYPYDRKITFKTYSQDGNVDDIDIVGMMYLHKDDEEVSDDRELRNYGKENEEDEESDINNEEMSDEKQNINDIPEEKQNQQKISQSQEEFYKSIAQARYQEHKLDKSMNLTRIDYKDEIVGTGKVADRNSVVTIQYKTTNSQNDVIEQTENNDAITFSLKDDISAGMKRIIVGMRENGLRKAQGPYQEIYDNQDNNDMINVEIKLLKVK